MVIAGFLLVLAAYLGLGAGYALRTPLWQAPDEPAHFNYARYVAERQDFPVLQAGDWDQEYLQQLTSTKFPPSLSTERLRYESHQPPLYYLFGAAVLRVMPNTGVGAQVIGMRFLSLFFGGMTLLVAFVAVSELFPRLPWVPWATAAFMAFLPQHTAMSAAVNNDSLAILLATGLLAWLLLRAASAATQPTWRTALVPGVLLGAVILTKVSLYALLALVPATLFIWARHRGFSNALDLSLRIILIASLVGGWWLVRNVMVYGPLDPLGLVRHEVVVVGQPRLDVLDMETAQHWLTTTFRSFWVQLGWMSVPARSDAYIMLLALTIFAAAGQVLLIGRTLFGRSELTPVQKRGLTLLAVWAVVVAGQLVVYNLRFIQPQGRYLFPALLPIALGFVLGWRELLSPRYAPAVIAGLLGLLALFDLYVLWRLVPLLA